jgi:DNA repair exonuclease SbcCD nuclease subunit
MKFAVLADIHAYGSTIYSGTGADGVNTRLALILSELRRAARTLKAQGGSVMFIAGDIFHTRGSIDPEVLNPLRETIEDILDFGIDIHAIPGNHDLKSKDSRALSSQIENLAQISIAGGIFRCYNEAIVVGLQDHPFGFVPWRNSIDDLKTDLEALKAAYPKPEDMHVFIHAGIDGVLSGMPAHGLTDADLAAYGFKRVYAGHYHNHVVFLAGKVVSVGATTHHNWGDVGTRAGFLIVDTDADTVTFYDTQAPKFCDLTGLDELDMELECKGNYVRFRGPTMTQTEINELRDQFRKWGALGVSIEVPKATVATRAAATPTGKGVTLDQSVGNFIDGSTTIPASIDKAKLKKRAQEVLDASRAAYEEA